MKPTDIQQVSEVPNLFTETGVKQSQKMEFWVSKKGQLYVALEDEELELRIIVVSHFCFGSHFGYTTICNIIRDKVFWDIVDGDVWVFLKGMSRLPFVWERSQSSQASRAANAYW